MRRYLFALPILLALAACSSESESSSKAQIERENAAKHFQNGKYPHPEPVGTPNEENKDPDNDDKGIRQDQKDS